MTRMGVFLISTTYFEQADFDIFSIPGLAPRMKAIQERIQPKFAAIGSEIADFLTDLLHEPMHIHIARHARRTVHPPDKTWVAWSANKRGYKPYPHFQFGIDDQSLTIWFAVFQECKRKKEFAQNLQKKLAELWPALPPHFLFSEDHTRSEYFRLDELTLTGMEEKLNRMYQVKKAEFLCGIVIPKAECTILSFKPLIAQIKETFSNLKPLYKISIH